MRKNLSSPSAVLVLMGMAVSTQAFASSHREAVATMNDPCIDNTDLYAWVEPGTRDKLYLIAGYAGLHEPGQGNQQARLCDDVLYEFHIARGAGMLNDVVTYQVQFKSTGPTAIDPATINGNTAVGGGAEILIQVSGNKQTYTVTKVEGGNSTVIGQDLPVAPPNAGPVTDRVAYGLGAFDPNDPNSYNVSLYNDTFTQTFVKPLVGGGRAFTGTRDDPFYLDEKGIFDLLNLHATNPAWPGKDVFQGFNLNVIALEIPTTEVTGTGNLPAHMGTPGNDTLLGIWASASRRKHRILRANGNDSQFGPWVQVGREGLPLFNAALVGTQDQGKYLRTTPLTDFANFGAYILNPVLVRDAATLGIYTKLNVDPTPFKTGRLDIVKAINLDDVPSAAAHSVTVGAGSVGDVLRVDLAIDSAFPNGRPIPGGTRVACTNNNSNVDTGFCDSEQSDVSDVIFTLVLAGGACTGHNRDCPLGDNVHYNDKTFLDHFPWLQVPWHGLEGHGGATP